MIDRHLRSPDLPGFDAPTIHHGINAHVARRADKGLWAEVR
ncbi:hypothetical protein [Ponticoccus alexandrii]|nr:hypothetical protein [Ponticoccus alexandrii]